MAGCQVLDPLFIIAMLSIMASTARLGKSKGIRGNTKNRSRRSSVPSSIVRQLATSLRAKGSVWTGRGRKPKDDERPTLIQELCRITGLDRTVVHRALSGKPRAGKRSPPTSKSDPTDAGTNRSLGLAQAMASIFSKGNISELNVAKNVANLKKQELAPAQTIRTDGVPAKSQNITNKRVGEFIHPTSPPPGQNLALPALGARGLEHIGLRSWPAGGHASSTSREQVPGPVLAATWSPSQLAAVRALEDGIDYALAEGMPPEAVKSALEQVRSLIILWRKNAFS